MKSYDHRKKTCGTCGQSKAIRDYYSVRGVLESCCKTCSKKPQVASAVARSALGTDNPFNWREFVQPVPMKAGKWEQQSRPHRVTDMRYRQYQQLLRPSGH